MSTTTAIPAREELFSQSLEPASRPNPYPLYARLRETPVSLQADGTYVVSTYREITALLHDPRISSDKRKSARGAVSLAASGQISSGSQAANPSFIFLDPPDHDRLRRLLMGQFTPARIVGMHRRIVELVVGLLDAQRGKTRFDVVDDFAYPLPVTVICELLGVPREDEPRFHPWAAALARSLDPDQYVTEAEVQRAIQSRLEMREYLAGLIAERRSSPKDDLLSGLVVGDDPAGRMDERELLATAGLLLVAGHETTVNLITNGTLALLRHPDALQQLRRAPDLVIPLVEEVLRYDPPVQFRIRTTVDDIDIAGVTIPKGASVVLVLASGNRDPDRFPDADRFIPDRPDNEHLGFGGGIHYCVGGPLGRAEAQIALGELFRRMENPRLVEDPPYRDNAALRGPRHLLLDVDGIR